MTDNRPTSALWYRQPAADPFEALPFGNGRLGGMIYGGQEEEYLQLNEISLWTGGPQDADNPDALKYLPQIRQLLQEGKYVEAQSLTYEKLVCKGEGTHGGASADYPYGAYQPLADLKLAFKPLTGEITDYRRDLDLETATAHVRFASGGARFEREVFSSAPDQVIALRLASDRPGQISFTARLSREADAAVSASGPDELLLKGRAWGGKGMRFAARLRIRAERGKLFAEGNSLRVEGADAVTLLLTGATDYTGIDPEQATKEQLQAAARKSYPSLRKRHTADYRRLYSRVSLNLGAPASEEPTDARFRAVQEGSSDPDLMALYFQYGRYLLISSSRPGSLPANLQGLWSWKMQPEWNADYHTNINVQMNYWPAEVANLAECHLPLFAFIDSLREPGRKTAKAHYGAGGWVAHTVTNIWGYTSPGEHPSWGQFPAAGAWLCQHLWEHYAFGGDKKFLEYAYPIMKGSAQFFLDFLVEEQKRGWLVTAPSNSPENSFRTPDGQVASVCMGPSMDEQILWDLFSHCIEASRALDTDAGFRARLEKARARLAPPQIGKHGQLMEWMEDWDEPEPGHRHISQAFAFHPGNQITLRGTPELAAAFRRTLERRLSYGGGQTGWSRAWVVSLWARFEEGDLALDSLINLFRTNTEANFFDLHPPHIFQIDGNFGAAAGIAEILLQSHAGEIALLPALPKAWPAGSVRGLRARGGAEVSLRWQDGLAASAEIKVTRSHTLRLRPPKGQRIATVAGPEGKIAFQGKDGVAEFEGKAGEVYRLRMQ
ncbi:MAG: glycoside hydrolase N-terminal domain-containing protein [Armatimonadetes bacterium]|nr:glycoside hydrolase N-terminal domain-containing protein [Armatimonadota bacterium]